MNPAKAALRLLRMGLHRRAFELHGRRLTEAAQALWAVVEEIDELLARLDRRRR